ncbi:Helix-turn-helix [Sphingomonas sp. YR710]|uniref:helix-turn-helix domain-containing protein n=1 Tax=Sphingomonas sp. YR710 TaxID=1882773 RepID=UPI00088741A1|nr:helix-turn-helix domain-containing protein [Sphingomonas sp. YR710]SDC78792.1 Helix-turn-helix [Sphingomonas sp. YR710]
MSEWPLDWRALVDEATRRRKAEGLTQKDLAALAGVSAPTVIAFERGEINLRLERVFAILDAVGLIVQPGAPDSLAAFIHAARKRWEELTATLDDDAPARQPHGHSEQAYRIAGVEDVPALGGLRDILRHIPKTSGWSPFWVPTKESIRPVIRDGLIECWIGGDNDRVLSDAAHSDFWQISRDGTAYLQRGYQEDGRDIDPGTMFDLTLPIWRTAEVLLHASALALDLGAAADTEIQYVARYTGLEGRELLAWAQPRYRYDVVDHLVARSERADIAVETSPTEIETDLPGAVYRAVVGLYDRFDGYNLPAALVENQIQELRQSAGFGRRPLLG